MISLRYSNKISVLSKNLSELLLTTHKFPDKKNIVVPNQNIESWLKIELTNEMDILWGLSFHTLEGFFHSLCSNNTKYSLLTKDKLNILLIDLLQRLIQSGDISSDPLLILNNWIFPDKNPNIHTEETSKRIFQLSKNLTDLFWEYSLSRKDMLKSWTSEPSLKSEYLWQYEIWKQLINSKYFINSSNSVKLIFPHDLIELIRNNEIELPNETYFFTFSSLSNTFQHLLFEISQKSDLYFYHLNPCREFWEDISPVVQDNEDPFNLTNTDNSILSLWGRPGRETIKLFNQLTQWDYIDLFEDYAESNKLLDHFKQDILDRKTNNSNIHHDNTIQFFSGSSIIEEIEIASLKIFKEMNRNQNLKFSDIAIAIVDHENLFKYRAHLKKVFNRLNAPHTFLNRDGESNNNIIQLLILLAKLPLSHSHDLIFKIIQHPLIMYKSNDLSSWIMEQLSKFNNIEDENYNYLDEWVKIIRQLTLSLFISNNEHNPDRGIPVVRFSNNQFDIPAAISKDKDQILNFINFVSNLIQDIIFIRNSNFSLNNWIELLRLFFTSYVKPQEKDDTKIFNKFLSSLNEIDLILNENNQIPFSILSEIIISYLSSLKDEKGVFWGNGICIGTLNSIHSIPFKIIFILGAGEHTFPQRDSVSFMDIRIENRLPGEFSKSEKQLYELLQTIISTEDNLYISWVSIGESTGNSISFSTAINDLGTIISKEYLAKFQLENEKSLDFFIRSGLIVEEIPKIEAPASNFIHENSEILINRELSFSEKSKRTTQKKLDINSLSRFLINPLQGEMIIKKRITKLKNHEFIRDVALSPFNKIAPSFLLEIFKDALILSKSFTNLKTLLNDFHINRFRLLKIKNLIPKSESSKLMEDNLFFLNNILEKTVKLWIDLGYDKELFCGHHISHLSLLGEESVSIETLSGENFSISGVLEPYFLNTNTIISFARGTNSPLLYISGWLSSILLSSLQIGFLEQEFNIILVTDKGVYTKKFTTPTKDDSIRYLQNLLNSIFKENLYNLPLEPVLHEFQTSPDASLDLKNKNVIKEFLFSDFIHYFHNTPLEWGKYFPIHESPKSQSLKLLSHGKSINFIADYLNAPGELL